MFTLWRVSFFVPVPPRSPLDFQNIIKIIFEDQPSMENMRKNTQPPTIQKYCTEHTKIRHIQGSVWPRKYCGIFHFSTKTMSKKINDCRWHSILNILNPLNGLWHLCTDYRFLLASLVRLESVPCTAAMSWHHQPYLPPVTENMIYEI